ncbi:hypothetical protein LIER_33238 [Lithospermum erythrorhizon]|uniref:Uncharacterized protein n=1 Tax=Lithospermum erythrorhizon TaxID=34254 RepID=A0AAV3RYM8_LITER
MKNLFRTLPKKEYNFELQKLEFNNCFKGLTPYTLDLHVIAYMLKQCQQVPKCFFFIRIPRLRDALKVHFDLDNNWSTPLMVPICHSLAKLQHDHYERYMPSVEDIIDNLSNDDIEWKPYNGLQVRTLLVPIFCNNNVVHHRPHLVPNQFSCLDGCDLSKLLWKEKKIKIKQFKGVEEQNFDKHYKKELDQWNSQKLVTDFLPGHFADAGGSGANEAEQPASTPTHPEEGKKKIHTMIMGFRDEVVENVRVAGFSAVGQQEQSQPIVKNVEPKGGNVTKVYTRMCIRKRRTGIPPVSQVELEDGQHPRGSELDPVQPLPTDIQEVEVCEDDTTLASFLQTITGSSTKRNKYQRGNGGLLRPKPAPVNRLSPSGKKHKKPKK